MLRSGGLLTCQQKLFIVWLINLNVLLGNVEVSIAYWELYIEKLLEGCTLRKNCIWGSKFALEMNVWNFGQGGFQCGYLKMILIFGSSLIFSFCYCLFIQLWVPYCYIKKKWLNSGKLLWFSFICIYLSVRGEQLKFWSLSLGILWNLSKLGFLTYRLVWING